MKKVAVTIVLLGTAFAGLVLLLPLALGSDTLKSALSRQLSEASGAEISLRGPIQFSVVPDFGIVAEDLSYVSGDGLVSATSERLVASVNLMSLLSDQIRITGIELRKPRIVLADAGETGIDVEPTSAAESGDDFFRLAAGYLQKLSFDRVDITDGEIAESRGGTVLPVASGVNLGLSVPGVSEPASLTFSGVVSGRKMELAADIGSLRDLLDRQPADFSLSAKMEQPPHPALADLSASGSIQLAGDGSYRIAGGEIDSAGQKMQLDASYVPGTRPFVTAKIGAGTLDYSELQLTDATGNGGASDSPGRGPDLSALRNFDADIELRVEAMRVGEAVASGIAMQAKLRDGVLNSTLSSQQIAGGSLAASMLMDVNSTVPDTRGSLNLTSIDIQRLVTLAGQSVPASGQLSSELGYAFLGLDTATIRESVNVKGTVSVADGIVNVPQLAEIAGDGAGHVEALDLKVEIADISTPLGVSGTANWNGEAIGFASSLMLTDLLAGQPGATSVDFRSRPVNAKFSGTVAANGSVNGRVDIAAASLSRALKWFGQDTGTPLGQFSYSGQIAAGGNRLALSDAAIALDDIQARGSVSVAMAEKTTIEAALSVDTLDLGKLTGGASTTAESTPAASGPATIDLSILRQLDADIRLDAKRVGFGKVTAGPARATLTVKDGVARFVVPEAGFYEGTVTADITANGAGKIPSIDFAARLDKVSALSLLTDAAGFRRIEGSLTAEVTVKGSGADSTSLARTLNGKAGAVFSDGALRGIDVARLVNNLQSLITTGYKEDTEAKTEFTELSVSFDIKDGVARTDTMRLLGPFVRMSGAGSVDLAAQTINMRLDPRVVGSLNGQGGDFDVSGLGMPVMVDGPLAGPRIYPDISGILANPGQALQMLSRLGGGVGELATGATGTADAIKNKLEETIGTGSGTVADSVVSGLIDQLGGGQAGEAGAPATDPRDLVGSLLQGIGGGRAPGQQRPQPDEQASLPPAQETMPPVNTLPGADTPALAPDAETGVVLPIDNVPIPTPNPRYRAAAEPSRSEQPDQQAPRTPTDEIVDTIVPHVVPEGNEKGATDLIKDLLGQFER